jgi:hypothetical protein
MFAGTLNQSLEHFCSFFVHFYLKKTGSIDFIVLPDFSGERGKLFFINWKHQWIDFIDFTNKLK